MIRAPIIKIIINDKWDANIIIVINLGKKPINGGSPPNLKSRIHIINIFELEKMELLIGDVIINLFSNINIGMIIVLYKLK